VIRAIGKRPITELYFWYGRRGFWSRGLRSFFHLISIFESSFFSGKKTNILIHPKCWDGYGTGGSRSFSSLYRCICTSPAALIENLRGQDANLSKYTSYTHSRETLEWHVEAVVYMWGNVYHIHSTEFSHHIYPF